MKKAISLLLVLVLCLSLSACGEKPPIEDEELVSKLESAVLDKAAPSFLFKGISLAVPTIHDLEEISEGKYDAAGEITLILKAGGEENVAFTAVMSIDAEDTVVFDSFDMDE